MSFVAKLIVRILAGIVCAWIFPGSKVCKPVEAESRTTMLRVRIKIERTCFIKPLSGKENR